MVLVLPFFSFLCSASGIVLVFQSIISARSVANSENGLAPVSSIASRKSAKSVLTLSRISCRSSADKMRSRRLCVPRFSFVSGWLSM